jgi:DNA-binding protein YbaB
MADHGTRVVAHKLGDCGMLFEPDDTLNAFQARVDEQTRQALRLSTELENAEVTLTSAGRELTVRINSAGGLTNLIFHSESDKLTRDELAELVLATSRRAQAQLAERVRDLVAKTYGADSGTANLVAEAYSSRYPGTDDEQPRRH